MASGLLQLFLIINVFLIGAASTIAFRHARAHFRPDRHDAEKNHVPPVKLPPEVKQRLLVVAEQNFQKILDNSASQLQLDLSKTSAQLNRQLDTLGTEIVQDEMKRYKASLAELQRSTEVAITSTQNELSQHKEDLQATMAEQQKELVAKMNDEVKVEKDRLLAQIDDKLSDAAASFLIETLQHNVDLGAQMAYITNMLEEHKDDFKKEVVNDENPAAN